MLTLYLDTVANRFATHGIEHTPRHCVRVCAHLMEGTKLQDLRIMLVQGRGWPIAEEVQPYLRATPADFMGAMPPEEAAEEIEPLILAADRIVAFNEHHHRRTLNALMIDAGRIASDSHFNKPWYCAMDLSAPIIRLRLMSQNRWKSPRIGEAYSYFTNQTPPDNHQWSEFAMEQIEMLRGIWAGIERNSERGDD